MNAIITAVVRLLGVAIIVGGIASWADAIANFVEHGRIAETGIAEALTMVGLMAIGSIVFALVPGLILLRFGSVIAGYVSPTTEGQGLAIQINESEAFRVGGVLLAFWFLVTGVGYLAGGVVQAVAFSMSDGGLGLSFVARSVATAAVHCGGAYFLFKRTRVAGSAV